MIQAFKKFEELEEKRSQTLKMYMLQLQDCLNVHRTMDLPTIYSESRNIINQVDHKQDLHWWADNHGVNMEHVLPHFQEYSGKRQRLATSSNSKEDIKATNNTSSGTSLKVPDLHSTSQQS